MNRLRGMEPRLIRLAKSIALFSGTTTLAQVVNMVFVLLVARVLGPAELGYFSSAYSLTGLSAFVLSLGMDNWLLRRAGFSRDVTALSGQVLKLKAGIGVLWALALLLIAPTLRPDLYRFSMMVVCVIDVWSDSSFNTIIQAMSVQRRMKHVAWLMFLSRGGRLIGLLILLLLGWQSALLFAVIRAAATVAGLAASLVVHRPKWHNPEQLAPRLILGESMPFSASEFLAMIYANADITLVALISGPQAVGLYSPASGIIRALFVVPNSIYNVIVPSLTRLGAESVARFRAALKPLFLGYAAVGGALWLGVVVTGRWLIPWLLGEQYLFTGELLAILSPILFLKSISLACAVVLVAVGWQSRRLVTQVLAALFNVAVNLAILPTLGIVGVSWVYVFSELLLVIGYLWVTFQWIRRSAAAPEPARRPG